MKGQSTVEFLGGMLIFIIALVISLTMMSGEIPAFTSSVEDSAHNMELYRVTNQLMTETGRHSYKSGGPEWEKNSSTIKNVEEFGLAQDYHVLDRDKVKNLSITGGLHFNYSQFRETTNVNNQYYFNFTWFPVVPTSNTFTRTKEPVNPPIKEPKTDYYSRAENRIHYGKAKFNGSNYKFLVAAFNGVYNTTYVSDDWNFSGRSPIGIGDQVNLGEEFEVVKFQNRDRRPGSSIVLKNYLNSFGVNPERTGETVTKINRYAVLDAPSYGAWPVRMEVLSW